MILDYPGWPILKLESLSLAVVRENVIMEGKRLKETASSIADFEEEGRSP